MTEKRGTELIEALLEAELDIPASPVAPHEDNITAATGENRSNDEQSSKSQPDREEEVPKVGR